MWNCNRRVQQPHDSPHRRHRPLILIHDFAQQTYVTKQGVIQPKASWSDSRQKRQEGILWQQRFWEHWIRDETDFARHCDYIHHNPVEAIEQSPDELVRALLNLLRVMQRQLSSVVESSVQQRTVLERMGGEPKHMLSVGGLSDRNRRQDLIAMRLQQKYRHNS